jgi:LPS O-antigen subunit length determinant protein (WzzB/FepE family)
MKKNNSYIDDEIDLSEIIKKIWNEKILILSISFIFTVAGFVYGVLQPKIYRTEIILREPPSYLFEAYQDFFSMQQQQQQQEQQQQKQQQQQQQDIIRDFNNNLKLNLSSFDTLVQFVEKTNAINDFKNHLKEKNISVEKYFQTQLGIRKFELVIDKKNNTQNKYSLTYSQPLPGEAFLNDYIIFAQQQTMTIFKQQLATNAINVINTHQQHLELAKEIDLDYPILLLREAGGGGRSVVNEPNALFYKGTKVLTKKITYLNKLLNENKNLKLDYNPILQHASSGSLITKSPKIYAAIALLGGLFFSLIIVLIRSVIQR